MIQPFGLIRMVYLQVLFLIYFFNLIHRLIRMYSIILDFIYEMTI